jgi:hypothetical protein
VGDEFSELLNLALWYINMLIGRVCARLLLRWTSFNKYHGRYLEEKLISVFVNLFATVSYVSPKAEICPCKIMCLIFSLPTPASRRICRSLLAFAELGASAPVTRCIFFICICI